MSPVAAGSFRAPVLLAGAAAAVVIGAGFAARDEHYATAGSGVGYALGVAGLAMMTLLLGYSARKRARWMAGWGPVRTWFHVHMALGLLGPAAVLLHCNFTAGAMNSAVALGSTLLVAASGIVGRVVYTRIHEELTGRRQTLRDLRLGMERGRAPLDRHAIPPGLAERLHRAERLAAGDAGGLVASLRRFAAAGPAVRSAERALRRAARAGELAAGVPLDAVAAHLAAVRRVARFSFYERVFALWHALHLPLCFLLFASAGIHVFAVHSY
jgi:hypothetical protein